MCFSCHFTPLASSHIREWWVNNPRNETHCIDIGSTPIRRRWLDPYGRLWKDKIRLVKMKHLLQKRVYRRAFCCWLIGAKEMRSWSSAKNIKDSKSVCVCVKITKNICINEVLVVKTNNTNHMNFKWSLAQSSKCWISWKFAVTSIWAPKQLQDQVSMNRGCWNFEGIWDSHIIEFPLWYYTAKKPISC